MATISDIARAADVPVESVLRVLNRDEVSSDVVARVLSAMDAHGYDRLPRRESGGGTGVAPTEPPTRDEEKKTRSRGVSGEIVAWSPDRGVHADDAVGRAREQLLRAVDDLVSELEGPEPQGRRSDPLGIRGLGDRMRILDARLERLTQDVDRMSRELELARNERLEDLTLLVDLITTSWRAADRRLGRIDHKLERIEGLAGAGAGDAAVQGARRFRPRLP